jgi:hypothetical protein
MNHNSEQTLTLSVEEATGLPESHADSPTNSFTKASWPQSDWVAASSYPDMSSSLSSTARQRCPMPRARGPRNQVGNC